MPSALWSYPALPPDANASPEPEPVLLGDPVRGVGERRGALVGGDDQVGVVAVEHADARRGARPRPSTRLSVMSSSPRMKVTYCVDDLLP